MKDFRGDSGFATWLFRITMNQCVDYARHKQSQPPTQPLVQGEDDEEREMPLPDTLHLPKSTWRTASWDASLPPRSMR